MQPDEMNCQSRELYRFCRNCLCAIVVIIMTCVILIFLASRTHHDHRYSRAKTQMTEFAKALDFYKMDHESYPTTEAGLKALTRPDKPSSEKRAKNPYIPTIPLDPWGHPYHYVSTGTEYELTCWGADGKPGGTGDAADIQCHDRETSGSRK